MDTPTTRNMSSFMEQMEKKFDELKSEFIGNLKSDLLAEIKNFISDQSEAIKNLSNNVMKHESTIAFLQYSVESIKNENELLRNKIDNNKNENEIIKEKLESEIEQLESYSRRQCLRLDGVKVSDGIETSENVVKIVSDYMKAVNVTFSDSVIDRAHRLGRVYENEQ